MLNVPNLKYLMECYFHQDLYAYDGTEWGGLKEFFVSDAHVARHIAPEICLVLEKYTSEQELAMFIAELGAEVYWGEEPGGCRAWLLELARRVSSHLDS